MYGYSVWIRSISKPAEKSHMPPYGPLRLSWAHPNADSVPSRVGIGCRFTSMPVELLESVFAGVPIPGVPSTKLGFWFPVVLKARTPRRRLGPACEHTGLNDSQYVSSLLLYRTCTFSWWIHSATCYGHIKCTQLYTKYNDRDDLCKFIVSIRALFYSREI
jgi:hypothetical protein